MELLIRNPLEFFFFFFGGGVVRSFCHNYDLFLSTYDLIYPSIFLITMHLQIYLSSTHLVSFYVSKFGKTYKPHFHNLFQANLV